MFVCQTTYVLLVNVLGLIIGVAGMGDDFTFFLVCVALQCDIKLRRIYFVWNVDIEFVLAWT